MCPTRSQIESAGLYIKKGHSLDVAFMNRPVSRLPSTLQFHKLGEDRYSLAVPKTHPLSRREYVSLRELKNERFIFHQTGQVAFELCRNACRNAGFEPHIVCHSENPTIGLYMVQGGLGLAFLPTEEFEHHRIDNIAEVKIIEPIIKEVGIAWRQDSSSPLVDTIVQFSRSWVDGSVDDLPAQETAAQLP